MDLDVCKAECEDLTYPELANLFKNLKDKKEEADRVKSDFQKQFDLLRLSVIPDKMIEDGISSISLDGIGRIGLTTDAHVQVLKENKEHFYSWMEDNGHGSLIASYVQPSTLKSFAKDLYQRNLEGEEGCELPEDLIEITPFMRASVTKR